MVYGFKVGDISIIKFGDVKCVYGNFFRFFEKWVVGNLMFNVVKRVFFIE